MLSRFTIFAIGSPLRPDWQVVFALQSAANASRFVCSPLVCSSRKSLAGIAGSSTPSSTSARTRLGKRCAYHSPMYVPYEKPR